MTEVNATKLAPIVMLCVVTLGLIAGVSFALATGITYRMESKVSNRNTSMVVPPCLGETINDPKPNKPVRH